MKLTRLHRVGLFVLGAAALCGAVTLLILDVGASGVAGVVGLILPGFLVLTFAIVGVFPNVHLKEGSIDWAKIEPVDGYLSRVEFERERKTVSDATAQMAGSLRKELATLSSRLEDYILANSPAPDDGLTDEQRLDEMREGYRDLAEDVGWRDYRGEDYDDGQYTEDLRKTRDAALDGLRLEERRQWAQYTFGMRKKPPAEW